MSIKPLIKKLFEFKIVRYGFIGGISTLIHIIVAFLYLHFVANSILFSNVSGFLSAFAFSYMVQSHFVFEHKLSLSKAWRYFIVQVVALMVSIVVAKYIPLDNYLRVIVVAFILPLMTFFIHKLWTFSTPKETDDAIQ